MRKFLFLKWGLLPLTLSLALLTTGCGGDDSEPEPPEPIEKPTPEEPTPEEPTPDEPTPDEPSNYYTPEESEFYGTWRVCWEKVERYRCFNGKWSLYQTDIYEAPDEFHKWYGWPYYLGFLKDAGGYLCAIWDLSAINDFDNLVSLVEQKGSTKYSYEVVLADGSLSGNSMFRVNWYPEANAGVGMLVFKSGKTVMWRWKITQFDGESFMVSPAHYDFDKPEDGAIDFFWSYRFVRYTPQN